MQGKPRMQTEKRAKASITFSLIVTIFRITQRADTTSATYNQTKGLAILNWILFFTARHDSPSVS